MAKVPFAEHDDVVKAVPSNRADQSFSIRILPPDSGDIGWSRIPIAFMRCSKSDAVGTIVVAQNILWYRLPTALQSMHPGSGLAPYAGSAPPLLPLSPRRIAQEMAYLFDIYTRTSGDSQLRSATYDRIPGDCEGGQVVLGKFGTDHTRP